MFKEVFEQGQKELRHVFGMELVELPMREKTKLSQRRGMPATRKPCACCSGVMLIDVFFVSCSCAEYGEGHYFF